MQNICALLKVGVASFVRKPYFFVKNLKNTRITANTCDNFNFLSSIYFNEVIADSICFAYGICISDQSQLLDLSGILYPFYQPWHHRRLLTN